VLFSASLISKSTSLTTMVETLAHRELAIYPALAFAGVAFTMVSLAENARVPVDNPATHLELTMIHEALILEYSGRHLALLEGAASLKLFAYSCIGLALFFPWGVAEAQAGLAPQNSLRSLRSLRSDSRGESDERSALRAPSPALRFSSPQKSPPPGTACRAVTLVVFVGNTTPASAKARAGSGQRASAPPRWYGRLPPWSR